MDIRFATNGEIAEWNSKVLANPDHGNIFQGDEFAEQKKVSGWHPRYIVAGDTSILFLEKSVFGLGKMWYAPKGPGVKGVVQLNDMIPSLRDFALKNDVFAVKVEPELEKTDDAVKAFAEVGLVPVAPIQPNFSTVILDLTPTIDKVLAGLNQKGRHAINRAERDGVTVKRMDANDENCRIFYQMLAETASAHGFVIRSYDYHLKFWQRYAASRLGQLFFAYVDDQVVCGAFAMVFGEKSTYKDGASVREKTVYGASHLLQWEVIKWAKEFGATKHDLCGAPPSDRINDETHPHYGIGRFKTSFNKTVTDYVGAYDIPVKPRMYGWWVKFGERLTKRRWWKKYGESWY